MQPEIVAHLPWVIGAGAVTVSAIGVVIKGYRWLLSEIRTAITEAIEHHTEVEAQWQREIERRLDQIESKVDRIAEREGK